MISFFISEFNLKFNILINISIEYTLHILFYFEHTNTTLGFFTGNRR